MISFIKRKKLSKPAWHYVENKLKKYNLITGCATLCSNNCNQAFVIAGNESVTSLNAEFKVLSIMASHTVLEAAKQLQTITLTPPCLTVLFMKFSVGFAPDVTGHTPSKKLNLCLISPQNICTKVLGIINIFFGKCETSLYVLFRFISMLFI